MKIIRDVYVIMSNNDKYILKGDPQHYWFHTIDDEPNKRIAIYSTEQTALKALKTTKVSLYLGNKGIEGKDLLKYCKVVKCKYSLELELK